MRVRLVYIGAGLERDRDGRVCCPFGHGKET